MILRQEHLVTHDLVSDELSNLRTVIQTIARAGVKVLERVVNPRKDLRSAHIEWVDTVTGRIPASTMHWIPARVDKCKFGSTWMGGSWLRFLNGGTVGRLQA